MLEIIDMDFYNDAFLLLLLIKSGHTTSLNKLIHGCSGLE